MSYGVFSLILSSEEKKPVLNLVLLSLFLFRKLLFLLSEVEVCVIDFKSYDFYRHKFNATEFPLSIAFIIF